MIPVRRDPIWVASLILCASPPARVVDSRESVRYSRPTSFRNVSRFDISFINGSATGNSVFPRIPFLFAISSRKYSSAFSTVLSLTDAIFSSPIFTPSASGRSRLPLHDSQTVITMYFSISARVKSESVSFQRRFRFGITPSNALSPRPSSSPSPSFFSPYKITSRTFCGIFSTAVLSENLYLDAQSSKIHQYHDWRPKRCDADAQGLIAPSAMVRRLLGITRSGSTSKTDPRPVHEGHAPYGELNERVRGSISGRFTPHSAQAKYWLKINSFESLPRGVGCNESRRERDD